MSKVRRKTIDCGPSGDFVLLSGDLDDVIEYLARTERDTTERPTEDIGGFVARFPSNNLYLWLDDEYDLTESIPHEASHMAISMLLRTGAKPDVSCLFCEEMLALHIGYISDKIIEQLEKWQA